MSNSTKDTVKLIFSGLVFCECFFIPWPLIGNTELLAHHFPVGRCSCGLASCVSAVFLSLVLFLILCVRVYNSFFFTFQKCFPVSASFPCWLAQPGLFLPILKPFLTEINTAMVLCFLHGSLLTFCGHHATYKDIIPGFFPLLPFFFLSSCSGFYVVCCCWKDAEYRCRSVLLSGTSLVKFFNQTKILPIA